jgi:hypothetical protein
MTLSKDCKISPHMNLKYLRATGRTPFAIIESKVINRSVHDAAETRKREKGHARDIKWLTCNLNGEIRMMTIGYAVLVTQHEGHIKVKCVRISNTPAQTTEFLSLQTSSRLSKEHAIPLGKPI